MSLINILENHLKSRSHEWIHKGELTNDRVWKKRNGTTYLSGTVDRKLREGETRKLWAVKPDEGNVSIMLKWLPTERRESYIPVSHRNKGKEEVLFRKE